MFPWHSWLHVLVGMVVVVNPLLAVSAFATLTRGEDSGQRRTTANRAGLTVLVVLSIAVLGGDSVLRLLGIDVPSFRLGGGILILLMAIDMLHARMSGARHTDAEASVDQAREQLGVVPLGIPLLAGPGAISTVMIYAHGHVGLTDRLLLLAGVGVVAILVWLALRLGEPLVRLLGTTGLNIATRVMGLLLAAIAVEFMALGLKGLFPGLG